MELLQFYYFVKIAEFNSVSRAAEALYVSQPSLSKMLSRIENEIGYELFDRNGKQLVLNEYGEVFLTYAQKIVRNVSEINDAMAEVDEVLNKTISLSSTNTSLIYDWMAKFIKEYHDINIRHHVLTDEQSINQLLSGDVDYGITLGPLVHPDIDSFLLWHDHFVLFTYKNNKLCRTNSGYLLDFKNAPFFSLPNMGNKNLYIERLAKLAGFKPNIIFEAETDVIMQVQSEIPAYIVGLEKADTIFMGDDNMHAVRLLDSYADCSVNISWIKNKKHNAAALLLLNFLKTEFYDFSLINE